MRVLLALVLAVVVTGGNVLADSLLFVSPLRVEIKPGETTSMVTVTNKSTQTRRYRVEMTDQAMTPLGVTETVETFPYSSKRMLRFMPRRIVLEPGQRQVVRIMARRPDGLPDGDYHTHLLFEEEQAAATATAAASPTTGESGLKLDMGATYGVAIPLVVQQGKLESALQLGDVQVARDSAGKPHSLLVGFSRTGNAEATAMLKVTDGPTDLITPRRVRIYREVDNVVITVPLLPAAATRQGPATMTLLADGVETPLVERKLEF